MKPKNVLITNTGIVIDPDSIVEIIKHDKDYEVIFNDGSVVSYEIIYGLTEG